MTDPPSGDSPAALSLTDFLTDGAFLDACAALSALIEAPVAVLDARGRRLRYDPEGPDGWALDAEHPGPISPDDRAFAIPLRAAGQVIGWVHAGNAGALRGPRRAAAEALLARMVSMADDDCANLLELRHRLKELAALSRLSALLAEAHGLERILDIALESALDLLQLSAGAIVLLKEDPEGGLAQDEADVELLASRNLSRKWLDNPLPLSKGRIFDRRALDGEIIVAEDLPAHPDVQAPQRIVAEGLGSALHGGLIYNRRPLGVIRLYGRQARRFTESDKRLLAWIGRLAAIAVAQARLLARRKADERIQRQVRLAADIQRRMLPAEAPKFDRIELAASYTPSFELSGDFYDYIAFDGPSGPAGLVVGDVVGKGVGAALLMSYVRASLRAHCQGSRDPGEVLGRVNRDLCRDTLPHEFVTIFFAVTDGASLQFASAGHDPPMLLRRADVTELATSGLIAGVDADEQYETREIALEPGDILCLCTDGVADSTNFQSERFGRGRLRESLARAGQAHTAPADIIRGILWDVRRFTGLSRLPDDQTMMVMAVR
ncbi:MAG: PP2C family protein-serine/threonine phosphatase [Phycisphaerales bacterium JB039]